MSEEIFVWGLLIVFHDHFSSHRSLSCQRITLHKNLFCSYVLNSALTIIYLVAVVNNPEVVRQNPVCSTAMEYSTLLQMLLSYITKHISFFGRKITE